MGKLHDVMAAFGEAGFFLETLTGLDFQDTQELVYYLNCYEARSRFAVRLLCGHDQSPPTVSDLFAGATWLEREVHEFYGIRFADSPDMRNLLLPEDADFHPLKKTFGNVHAYHRREEIYG
jgi:NADH-quinone oxidoreductase subunit C